MGINISDTKEVSFDDTHQKRVNTSLTANPHQEKVGSLPVHHVFRRNRTGENDGDGNPLMFALKQMRGYTISNQERDLFMARSDALIRVFSGELDAEYILPILSSKAFCGQFAQLVSDVSGIPIMPPDFMRKKTISEILDDAANVPATGMGKTINREFKSQLNRWQSMRENQSVSMKDVNTRVRKYFEPMTINADVDLPVGAKIVIVDDLKSSGATIISTYNLLASAGFQVSAGVCFLSGLQ